ncbi:hypothetical protein RC083_12595 [Pseudoalteromonas haloplanktis]|uniref:HEAT repeat domain-containing protein n=1 Tax=Pseudoalteromonas haloplanktis TaxID=228 RepID=A0ABU1BFP6_PSEHA|nr:hypothetical protein [Pseudoalteromonas haloplanktis]MDQ9092427.1 hypothetical protein [Pseudoalteromonas haloplanktis]
MPINKGSVAIVIATIAIAISCYGTFFAKHVVTPHAKQNAIHQNGSEILVTNIPLNNDYNELSIDLLNKKITALQLQLANLQMQNPAFEEATNHDEFKELVIAVLNEKDQQEAEKMRKSNPLYDFYAGLPEDYDLRLKSEPAYAENMAVQLRQQILDQNASDINRLAALAQLQMNLYILNQANIPEYDYEVFKNVLDLADNSHDDKFKIQAIEITTQSPVLDYRLAERFTALLEQDSNEYIRRLAGQGLVTQFYQAQSERSDYSQQIAQHILSLYQDSADDNVYSVLNEMIGNENMLAELQKYADGGS